MKPEGRETCSVCCHHCSLSEGQTGACGARKNIGGRILPSNYGKLTSLALDPIEKKPLARFFPGSRILSVGSYGCSLRCPFCQNYEIAAAREERSAEGHSLVICRHGARDQIVETAQYSPRELCELALELRDRGNIGIAFTYNEPLVGWEFVRDTAKLFHENGLKTVLVTNGMASREVLAQLLPFVDAMNIDLKGFTEEFYREFVGGDLEMVKSFISAAVEDCHVELTKLIIPGKNDSGQEMREMASWIASLRGGQGQEIPLHVSRYFPRYQWDAPATKVSSIYRLAETAREFLKYVYTGNC